MSENKWNEKLRRRMDGFGQAPPEGLWEGVQAGLEAKRRAVFPWPWVLAGAAAAAALLLLINPAGIRKSTGLPSSDGPVLAEADSVRTPETLPAAGMPEDTTVVPGPDFSSAAWRLADESASGFLHPEAPVKDAPSVALEEAPVKDSPAVEREAPAKDIPSVEQQETPVKDSSVVNRKKVPEKDSPSGNHPVGLQHSPAVRPLLAKASDDKVRLSFMAAGIPGGGFSNSITEYGMPSGQRMAPHALSSVLSRNRSTLVQSEYRLNYRLGVMANIPLTRHWSVESGLQLSCLAGLVKSSSGNDMTTESSSNLYYLGVPLYAVFTPWEGRHLGIYLSAGPMAELGVRLSGSTKEIMGSVAKTVTDSSFPGDLIWSLGANAGLQWKFGGLGALFIQPGLSWHIPAANSPQSYYTEHPLAFTLGGGYRILF